MNNLRRELDSAAIGTSG